MARRSTRAGKAVQAARKSEGLDHIPHVRLFLDRETDPTGARTERALYGQGIESRKGRKAARMQGRSCTDIRAVARIR